MTTTWMFNGELYRLEIRALSARFCVCCDDGEWIVLAEPRRASPSEPFRSDRLPEAVRELLQHPPFTREASAAPAKASPRRERETRRAA